MKAYVDMWVIRESGQVSPDEDQIIDAVRAVPGVVMADRTWGSTSTDDLILVLEVDDAIAFEAALAALDDVHEAASVSSIRLVRGRT